MIVSLTAILSSEGLLLYDAFQLDKTAVAAGEYWRLFTVTLVHGSPQPGFFVASLAHLFFNMYALYLAGPIVERWYGPIRFLLFYLLCAAGGSIASFVFGGEAAVGRRLRRDLRAVRAAARVEPDPSPGRSAGSDARPAARHADHHQHRCSGSRSRTSTTPRISAALLTGLWIGALWPPTNVETTSSFWQRDRDAQATRLASVALVVPILVVGVVALAVVLGIAVGSPRFLL